MRKRVNQALSRGYLGECAACSSRRASTCPMLDRFYFFMFSHSVTTCITTQGRPNGHTKKRHCERKVGRDQRACHVTLDTLVMCPLQTPQHHREHSSQLHSHNTSIVTEVSSDLRSPLCNRIRSRYSYVFPVDVNREKLGYRHFRPRYHTETT